MASDGTVAARLLVEVGARGLSQTSAGLAGMGTQVGKTQMGIGGLVKAAGGLYAVKKGFDATIGSAIAWESEFAGVEKTVDGTAAELGELENELLGMHRTMPVARADIAGIAEAAGALGIATPDIAAFTETVAMIGETTNVSSEQAASSLGKLSNVLGLTVDDYDNFGAALVDLGNKGASTEQEILGIAERAGAGASLINIAADETLGWSAAVANLGIEAEAGGSALQRFFLGMTEHVAGAGAELDTIARTAGMTADEFTRAFEQDASGALQSFVGGMEDLTQAEQLALLEMLKFSDVRISRTLLGLAGNTENLNDALVVGAEGWDDNTALVEEYGKRADTTAAKIEVLGNRLGDLGRRAGESQGGVMDFLIEDADKALTEFEHLADNIGDVAFSTGIFFGDLSNQADELAASVGMNRDEFKALANAIHAEFGGTSDEVFQRTLDNINGIAPAVSLATRGALAAWKQEDLGGTIAEDLKTGGTTAVDAYLNGFNELSEGMTDEMIEARAAAVDGMAITLNNLNDSLRDGKDGYEASWQDFLDGQTDPFTTAQRAAFIAGQFTGDEFDSGLHSKDPEHVANTVEYVNSQLAEFEVLVPGALQTGKDVPAALQSGMEEIMPELQEYVKAKTGETLENLTLEEAHKLGLDGIWYWFQGMKDAEESNKLVAGAIASRAVNSMDWSDLARQSGYRVGTAWADGLWASASYARDASWAVAMAGGSALVAFSPPKEGPLSTIDESGMNVGKTWAEGLAQAATYASDAANVLAGAAVPPGIGLGAVAGNLGPDVASGGGGMTINGDYRPVHVHVEGQPLDGSVDELARVIQGSDSVSDWAD